MGKGYWIVRVDIREMETYTSCITANAGPFRTFGAKFLVRGGKFANAEGTIRGRNAVIEFPCYGQAVKCWHSPEYQTAVRIREPVSTVLPPTGS